MAESRRKAPRKASPKKVVVGDLHKERDGRRMRELITITAFGLLILMVLLAIVWHRVEEVRLGYDTIALGDELDQLQRDNARLRLEREALLSLDRIEGEARRLGLVSPDEAAVRAVVVEDTAARAAAPVGGAR